MGQLVQSLSGAVQPQFVGAVATLFGDTTEATGRAFAAILPTVLGALSQKAGHGQMEELMALVPGVLSDGNPLDQLQPALSDTSVRTTLMAHGDTMATHLFGVQQGPVTAAITQASGARGATVANLVKLGGPVVLGLIARQLGGTPTAQGISDLLEAERPAISAALPPGMFALLAPLGAEPTPLHGTPVEGAAAAAAGWSRWLPWLLAAVAAIALIAGLQSCRTEEAREAAQAPAPTPLITQAPEPVRELTLADGSVVVLRPGTVALELVRYLSGTDPAPREFRFDDIGYDTAENRMDAASVAVVKEVAAVLTAYPQVRVRIIGHSDAEGDDAANLALSQSRAKRVETVLENNGIAEQRVESEGLGETQPIATNETAEGRAQNLRTVIRVIER